MAGLGRRSHYRKHLTDAVLHDLPEPDESLGQRIARVVGTRGGNMFDVIVAPAADGSRQSKKINKEEENGSSSNDEAPTADSDKNQSDAEETSDKQQKPPIHSITQQRTSQLAFLPTKFRKLVWIKRNDFVIVECGDEEEDEEQNKQLEKTSQKQDSSGGGGGFRYVITHILYKDQVKHIKSKGLWPADPYFADSEEDDQKDLTQSDGCHGEQGDEDNGGQEDGTSYEENGIVFDDPLGDDMMMVNTNRIATLRVEDSSSEEDSDDE